MSTEFIIGTVIGLTGLFLTIIMFLDWASKRKRNQNLQGLMNQLVNDELSQDKQQKKLREISAGIYKIGQKKLSDKYIKNFLLEKMEKRGKEAVFRDMCNSNNIRPTPELSNALLGYVAWQFINQFHQQPRQTEPNIHSPEEKAETVDNRNKLFENRQQVVYMSELLYKRYPETCNQLIAILDKHKVSHKEYIIGTKDIWCKDYMPIQTSSGKLVQFRYEPSYLKGYEYLRSDVRDVCKLNNIQPIFSDINLDGGNVLICSDRAIISDRVFDENSNTNRKELISKLEKLLEAEVIIIPAQKSDLTGHADGMVRFVDRNTILGNDRELDFKNWKEKMNKVLKETGLRYLDVPFFGNFKDIDNPFHAIGVYVNYLEVNDLIVLPIFEVSGNKDTDAIACFTQIFPNRKIDTINYNKIGLKGGLLNCTTWTIYE